MPEPYITPRALIHGPRAADAAAAGQAWPMLGKGAFTAIDVTANGATALVTRAAFDNALICSSPATKAAIDAQLAAMATPRPAFAGLDLSQPRIMGVVNVTPDSFSDGGAHATPQQAIAHALTLAEAGADILDIGGESTRPGAAPVSPEDEQRRIIAVVRDLANRGLCVSVDTRHAVTMGAAIAAGARIVNDITALADPAALQVVSNAKVAVILMHIQGDPRTMQDDPRYAWAPGDVCDVLARRVAACTAAGIDRARIGVDPGIGFGKTPQHSAQILDHMGLFHGLGCAVAVGVSRKRFIASLSRGEPAERRLAGSLAAALTAVAAGVQIVRVHDVAETRQALNVAGKIANA